MKIQILIDADEFWPCLRSDIESAREYMYLQSLSFEGDRVGRAVADAVARCEAADRRIIADDFYTRCRINDKYLYHPRHWFNRRLRRERADTLRVMEELKEQNVRVKLTNPSGVLGVRAFARNHKKIVAIDDRVAYIGGMNVSEHNFEWHDMMVRIEGQNITRFLKEDFMSTWRDRQECRRERFEGVEIFSFDGRGNEAHFAPILEMIDGARESIFLESPYVSQPFFRKLAHARRRGVNVTLITPQRNNWKIFKEYSLWSAARARIDVRLYPERMAHLKAMLIDHRYLIAGSSNFDFLSFRFLQEIVAVITDPAAVREFAARVLETDLEKSAPPTERVGDVKGYCHHANLKMVEWVFGSASRIGSAGQTDT